MELFVWIRGAFRSCGIGSDCLDSLLPQIRSLFMDRPDSSRVAFVARRVWPMLDGPPDRAFVPFVPRQRRVSTRLIVRLPERGTSPAERQEFLQWLNFYYDFNFRRRRVETRQNVVTLELMT